MTARHGIGGSDCGAILGLDPRRSPLDVWRSLQGAETCAPTAAMDRGKVLESAVLDRYVSEHRDGRPLATRNAVVTADGWRRAQLDALATEHTVEVKTILPWVAKHEWGEPGSDQCPDRTLAQVLWGMDLASRQRAEVVVAVLPQDIDEVLRATLGKPADEAAAAVVALCELRVYAVDYRPAVARHIRDECARFWNVNVKQSIQPDPRDFEEAQARWWNVTAGKRVEADAATLTALRALALSRDLGKAADEIGKRAKFIIATSMQDAEALTFGGVPIAFIKEMGNP